MIEPLATWNCSVAGSVRCAPELLVTPVGPAGMVTVTALSGMKPVVGVKVSVVPALDQVPAVVGVSVGSGDVGERAEEKLKTIAAAPLPPVDPFPGASEVS